MSETTSFVPFGASHLAAIATILLISLGLPLALRWWPSEKWITRIAVSVGVLAIVHELLKSWAWVAIWNQPWTEALPLELCGAAVFLTAILLIRRDYRIYEVVYFWGLAGALQALLTPEVPYDFPHVLFTPSSSVTG